jgi:hypothetical protein
MQLVHTHRAGIREVLVGTAVDGAALASQERARRRHGLLQNVAAKVVNLEKQRLETRISLHRLKG